MSVDEQQTKWEYQIVIINVQGWIGPSFAAEDIENPMNRLGKEGWELVNVLDVNTRAGETKALVAVFKRRV